MVLHLSM